MKRLLPSLAAGAAIALLGCVPSVNPLYTAKDLIFDPALLGTWAEEADAKASWTFDRRDATSYRLIIREDDESAPFIAHLVKLGDHRFLDICPDKSTVESSNVQDIVKTALIRGHLILKLSAIEPALQLWWLSGDWLEQWLKDNPGAIAHQMAPDGGFCLTATTRDLQKFVLKHLHTKDAWGDKPSDLKRQAAATPAPAPTR